MEFTNRYHRNGYAERAILLAFPNLLFTVLLCIKAFINGCLLSENVRNT
jgi:hypothetical protein